MKKMKKLLSVLLAVILALSCMSVMASAYVTDYKTASVLEEAGAYGSIDTVSRLTMDRRADMVLDMIDNFLPSLNIKMDLSILGTLDATSVDALLNSIRDLVGNGLFSFAGSIGLIGDLKSISAASIDGDGTTYDGARRTSAGLGGQYVLYELFMFVNDNVTLIQKFLEGTLTLGAIVEGAIGGSVNKLLGLENGKTIANLVAGLITGLLQRKDDTKAEVENLASTTDLDTVITNFVSGLFTKPMSTQTVKCDASGNITSKHSFLKNSSSDARTGKLRYNYVVNADGTVTSQIWTKGSDGSYSYKDEYVFSLEPEVTNPDGTPADKTAYVYVATDDWGNKVTLKYYADESYWLPEMKADNATLNLKGETAVGMLYKMIPYVFDAMAPVVLNGSVKKLLGEWFGAVYNEVGQVDSAAVKALPDASDTFFTQPQGAYLWEWSDYKVIKGTHYYRFEDTIFVADTSNANEFFNIIDYDYKITAGFLDQFVPASTTDSSDTILQELNNIIGKFYNAMIDETYVGYTWVSGTNNKVLDNLRDVFVKIFSLGENSAEKILQGIYDKEVVDMFADESVSNSKLLGVLAGFLVHQLMPQMILPEWSKIDSVAQVLVMVVREFASQLIPGNNFDALIYSNYAEKTLVSRTDSEWVDVLLTMGAQIGVFYLNNITDLDLTNAALGGYVENKTWKESDLTVGGYPAWEASVDFIIDWALEDDGGATAAWKMKNFVDTTGLDVDRNVVQDPWVKLNKILFDLLPIDQILNVTATKYGTKLEQALRGNFVDAIIDLDVERFTNMFAIPDTSILRTMNVLPALAKVIRDLLNGMLGFGTKIIPDSIDGATALLNITNLKTIVKNLCSTWSTNREAIINTALPILNFFVGYSPDEQTFAPATVSVPRYTLATNGAISATITVQNNATGMPRKYYDTATGTYKYDDLYKVRITEVISSVSGDAVTLPGDILPGTNANITITNTIAADTSVEYTIKYQIIKGDGSVLNNMTFETTAFSWYTLVDSDEYTTGIVGQNPVEGAGNYENKNMIMKPYKIYVFTTDPSLDVPNMRVETENKGSNNDARIGRIEPNTAMPAASANYFTTATTPIDLVKPGGIIGITVANAPNILYPFVLKDGVNPSNIPYGIYDLGNYSMKLQRYKLSGFKRTWQDECGFDVGAKIIYYNDYDIHNLYNQISGAGVLKSNYDLTTTEGNAAWNRFMAAWEAAADLVNQPYYVDSSYRYTAKTLPNGFLADVAPKFESAQKELDAAWKDLNKYAVQSSLLGELDTAVEAYDDINFQDVPFYRYARYEKAIRAAWDIQINTKAPTAEESKYINGVDYNNKEIDAIIAAEENTFIKGLLENSVIYPELGAFTAAKYTDQEVAIVIDNLALTYARILDKADYPYFLQTEIAAAKAKVTDSTLYTANSWARYSKALADAEKVVADSTSRNSELYSAKWELMCARKALVLNADVAGLDKSGLQTLYNKAMAMLAAPENYAVVETYKGTETDAWTELLIATGYKETVTSADGGARQVYSGSAQYNLEKDLVNNLYNKQKIDNNISRLQAAIDNFVSLVAEKPELVLSEVGEANGTVIDKVSNCADRNGFIYGIDLGESIEAYLATPAGSIRVTANASGEMSTGATIELLDANNNVVETYIYVVFGDVNGDGLIEPTDLTIVDGIANYCDFDYSVDDGTAESVAMDVNGDGLIEPTDLTIIDGIANYSDFPTQAELAAVVASNKGIS